MSNRFSILVVSQSAWGLVAATGERLEIAIGSQSAFTDFAAALSTQLDSRGLKKYPLVIGIPAAWCLSASISTHDLPSNDARSRIYRLEENLPLAAENMIADFVSSQDAALGVCVRLERIQPVVDALQAAGVRVHAIVPTVLATAQGLAGSVSQTNCLFLSHEVENGESKLNLIGLQDRRPVLWDLIPATAQDLKLQLELLSTRFGSIPHIEAIDLDPQLAETLVETSAQVINLRDEKGSTLAAILADEVLSGRTRPWINFRRDQLAMVDSLELHRPWIDLALVSAIVFFLSLTTALFWRAPPVQPDRPGQQRKNGGRVSTSLSRLGNSDQRARHR